MKKESITFKIERELKDRLRDFCDSNWRTMTSVITESVLDYLDQHDNKHEPTPATVQESASVEDRLQRLTDLKEKNLITDDEYVSRRNRILEEV